MNNNIKLIADVTLLCNDKVLLVKYKDANKYDHQRGWFLPDDVIMHGENPNDAACRIINEQLGSKEITSLVLDHVESFTGNGSSWHLVFHFVCHLAKAMDTVVSEEIEEEKWFSIDELPDEKEMAHHGWAKTTIDKIMSKQNYD
jgi:ADP-ribose pyrophosphatase YjhB (NUDIX family)